MSDTITRTYTITEELERQLIETINFLNASRITGEISKSKIIRLALMEFIQKQQAIRKILEENKDANKSAQEILRENERA